MSVTISNPPITEKGWHGSQTRIKILPSDFLKNDDRTASDIAAVDIAVGSEYKFKVEHPDMEIYAHVVVPQGYKATGIKIAGSDTTNRVLAYEACVVGCVVIGLISAGIGDPIRYVGTEYDFDTEMVAGPTNYIVVKVAPAASDDYIYGGYINIEKV
tara:strand:+ start:8896 stop:9366 length:471 start_codon:yes stop_codon:yes gene_type:complete